MRSWATPLLLLLPQLAYADCVYTGAKRAYIECIYGEVVAFGAGVLGFGAELLNLGATFDWTDGQLSMASGQVTSKAQELGGYELDLQAYDLRTDLVDATLSPLPDQLAALQTTVAGHGAALGPLFDTIGMQDLAVAAQGSELTTLGGDLSSLQTRVVSLQGELAFAQAELADHEAVLNGLVTGGGGLFSAYIQKNNGTPSMITETGDWISSLEVTGTGTRVIFNAGLFSSTPHCVCLSTHYAGVTHMACDINSPLASRVDVFTSGLDGTARNRDFWLYCRAP